MLFQICYKSLHVWYMVYQQGSLKHLQHHQVLFSHVRPLVKFHVSEAFKECYRLSSCSCTNSGPSVNPRGILKLAFSALPVHAIHLSSLTHLQIFPTSIILDYRSSMGGRQ